MSQEKNEPIEIHLEQKTHDSLIEIFVRTELSKESLEVFNDYLAANESVPLSLARAVINEMANIALKEELERGTFAETLKEQQNKEDNNDTDKNT